MKSDYWNVSEEQVLRKDWKISGALEKGTRCFWRIVQKIERCR